MQPELRDIIKEKLEHVTGQPARDIYNLMLQVDIQHGPGNDGMLHVYMKEALATLEELLSIMNGDTEPSETEEADEPPVTWLLEHLESIGLRKKVKRYHGKNRKYQKKKRYPMTVQGMRERHEKEDQEYLLKRKQERDGGNN